MGIEHSPKRAKAFSWRLKKQAAIYCEIQTSGRVLVDGWSGRHRCSVGISTTITGGAAPVYAPCNAPMAPGRSLGHWDPHVGVLWRGVHTMQPRGSRTGSFHVVGSLETFTAVHIAWVEVFKMQTSSFQPLLCYLRPGTTAQGTTEGREVPRRTLNNEPLVWLNATPTPPKRISADLTQNLPHDSTCVSVETLRLHIQQQSQRSVNCQAEAATFPGPAHSSRRTAKSPLRTIPRRTHPHETESLLCPEQAVCEDGQPRRHREKSDR